MPTFQELTQQQQQDPAAMRLRMALEATTARTKAEAHLTIVSRALDEATQVEEQARTLRDGLLADLQQTLDALANGDERGRADLALERAEINDDYKPFAVARERGEDQVANAERDLKAAMADVEKCPLPASTP